MVAQTEGVTLEVESVLEQEIRKGQLEDIEIKEIRETMEKGKAPDFTEDDQGTTWFRNRICVPDVGDLQKTILREAHDSAYSIHPGSTKMYQDLKQRYWWYGMKRDVAAHVALCDTCHRVKAEHQRPAGLLQPLMVLEWKWEEIGMDFIVGLCCGDSRSYRAQTMRGNKSSRTKTRIQNKGQLKALYSTVDFSKADPLYKCARLLL
jgi:hypothetical protein